MYIWYMIFSCSFENEWFNKEVYVIQWDNEIEIGFHIELSLEIVICHVTSDIL